MRLHFTSNIMFCINYYFYSKKACHFINLQIKSSSTTPLSHVGKFPSAHIKGDWDKEANETSECSFVS